MNKPSCCLQYHAAQNDTGIPEYSRNIIQQKEKTSTTSLSHFSFLGFFNRVSIDRFRACININIILSYVSPLKLQEQPLIVPSKSDSQSIYRVSVKHTSTQSPPPPPLRLPHVCMCVSVCPPSGRRYGQAYLVNPSAKTHARLCVMTTARHVTATLHPHTPRKGRFEPPPPSSPRGRFFLFNTPMDGYKFSLRSPYFHNL